MKGFSDLLRGAFRNPIVRKALLIFALFVLIGWCITGLFELPGYGAFSFTVAILVACNTIRLFVNYLR